MKIIPLTEGTFTIDQSKLFIPFDETKDKLAERNRGSLLVEIQPFLVITSKDIILLDTGLGFEHDGKLQLHENINAAGIDIHDISKVLLSHLHKDHAGGISYMKDGIEQLSLPNAKYYIQTKEMQYAFEKGFPSYTTDDLEFLRTSPQIELISGNGVIDNYIQYEITEAHSPFHQVFWIRENEEIIFFGADDAPQFQQMKHRFVAKYDYDGKKAMQLRQDWWTKGEWENWTFLFYHDIHTPVYNFSEGTKEA
jgi:glyoxylase-like metal-dependent hydrolase (beta-lactamase superfamily II)